MSGPSDEQLAEQVRGGDAAAFEALVRRHLGRAWSVGFRILGHREDAEDVAQEAFAAMLREIDRYQRGRPWAPWFFRIVANRAINARRSRGLREADALPDDLSASRPGPDRDSERAELRDGLARALATLPDRQRTVVQLFDVDGFSGAEIAAMLGLSEGTVRWHLHQARAALRVSLRAFHEETV